ncbi:membrane protein insertase YidC [Rhizomonospora bruguierae]|uniref:membrane protein insertase YidC n=1 Tax=Rhizomonospora bruguierae TaxID=1581705 RepID=UPI001BCAC5A8|nr:membrane protein insertase YidC [Micromonospora sp. NBRC 107566]
MSLDWIYTAISWILLKWHSVWDAILPGVAFLGTNWDWILAIVFLVVTLRVILFPVFVKQIKSQRAMQALSPQIKALQEKHKGDRETLQKEMMELYRKEKANPLMGCLPMFLQIPVFIGLLHVLRRLQPTNDLKDIYGWTVGQFNSATAARLFTAPISDSFATGNGTTKIVAMILVLMMTVTTYLTSRQMILKTGWAADPQQKMIQRLMLYGIPASLLFSGFIYPFPIGVVIYWVTNNLFSLAQQQWVLRKYPPPPMAGRTSATATAGAARKNGGPVQDASKGGLLARFRPQPPAPEPKPAVTKANAPRPGAKPVNPKKGGAARRQG